MTELSLNMRSYSRRRPVGKLIEDVKKLCRLCLKKSEDIMPIFQDGSNGICATLSLRIMICVGLEVTKEECLPNIICSNCHQELDRYYKFKKKCQESYQRLKLHLQAIKEGESLRKAVAETNKEGEEVVIENTNCDVEKNDKTLTEKSVVSDWDYNGLANINIVDGDVSIEVQERCSVNVEEKRVEGSKGIESQMPDGNNLEISSFLSTVLIQLGILGQKDSTLSILDQNINNIELVMGGDEMVTLELVEEDDDSPEKIQNTNMENQGMPIVLDSSTSTNESHQGDSKDVPPSADVVEQVMTIKWQPEAEVVGAEGVAPAPEGGAREGAAREGEGEAPEGPRGGAWCSQCRRWFANGSTLRRHIRTHSGERPYACHCGRRFSQRAVLERHRYVHLDRRPFECPTCGKGFTQRGALDAHARAHAPADARPLHLHACTRCPKVFLYSSSLSRHMMMHKGRVYNCTGCEREFKDKSSLLRHLRTAHIQVLSDLPAYQNNEPSNPSTQQPNPETTSTTTEPLSNKTQDGDATG